MEAVVSWVMGTALVGMLGAIAWLVKTVIANTRQESELKVWALEKFVAREDYVQQTVLINAKLDSMGATVARVDERLTRAREGI